MKKVLIWLSVCCIAYHLWSCANPQALTGGEKDMTPPKVVKDGMLPMNEQTNFEKQDITFTFDEFVKIDDVANEVVISPPLDKTPDIRLKNKELIFSFDPEEVLKEEVTYTINFGEAVKDLTENNPADLRYVFSTGDFIDSLVVSGSVVDAISKEPVKDCLVMLYQNLSDTIVRTENPYYFVKTGDSGRFKIENVKEGVFKIFALHEDQGKRYIFDNNTEGIGFLEKPIIVNDSMGQGITLQVFKEEEELELKDEELKHYGHAWFVFNREPYDLQISHEEIGQNLQYVYKKDSVHLWYDTEDEFQVYLANDTLWTDTVKIKALEKATYLENAKLKLIDQHDDVKKVLGQDGVFLEFGLPVSTLNNDLVDLYADTTQTLVEVGLERDTGLFRLKVVANWEEATPYELVLLPGAVEDNYGIQNDTIRLSYMIQSSEDFGEIRIMVTELDSTVNYILKVLNKSNTEKNRYIIKEQSTFKVSIPNLEPGEYKVELVQDSNQNGRWDTGSYDDKTYPEVIYTQNVETLRANWTVEVNVAPGFDRK